jgi:hypothetical protein
MNICACGDSADGHGIRCSRCTALGILDLEPGATEEEIKSAYHTLVKVWHPDRFQHDEGLRESAEAKLKDINTAFKFLSSLPPRNTRPPQPDPVAADATSGRAPRAGASTARQSVTGLIMDFDEPAPKKSGWIGPVVKHLTTVTILLVAVIVGRYIWLAFDLPDPTGEATARVLGDSKDTVLNGLEGPKKRFIDAVKHDLVRLNLLQAPAEPEAPGQEAATTSAGAATTAKRASTHTVPRQLAATQAEPHKILSFLTIGSTKDEVLAQQGPPTAATNDKLVYGKSELYLRDGSVIGWKIDPVSDPIRVKLWPEHPVDTNQEYFTVDSTRDDVLVVQGTPTAFSKDKFEYGGSEVYFQRNRVVGWKSDLGSVPLKARMP